MQVHSGAGASLLRKGAGQQRHGCWGCPGTGTPGRVPCPQQHGASVPHTGMLPVSPPHTYPRPWHLSQPTSCEAPKPRGKQGWEGGRKGSPPCALGAPSPPRRGLSQPGTSPTHGHPLCSCSTATAPLPPPHGHRCEPGRRREGSSSKRS